MSSTTTTTSTPKWTPINPHPIPRPTSPTSTEQHPTDDDYPPSIPPWLLQSTTLLKLAARHTNKSLLRLINSRNSQQPLSENWMRNRINRTLTLQAALQGRSRKEVKAEFDEKRRANGVINQKFVDMGRKSGKSKRAKQAAVSGDGEEMVGYGEKKKSLVDEDDDDVVVADTKMADTNVDQLPRIPWAEPDIHPDDLSNLPNATIQRMATEQTNAELLAKVNNMRPNPTLTERALGARLGHALTARAKFLGRAREDVKADFEKRRSEKRNWEDDEMDPGTTRAVKKAKLHAADGEVSMGFSEAAANEIEQVERGTTESYLRRDGADAVPTPPRADSDSDAVFNLRQECLTLIKTSPDTLFNSTLFNIAGVLTNAEIAAAAGAGTQSRRNPIVLSSKLISERIWKATKFVAERDGKTREEAKAVLEARRRENGVLERAAVYARQRQREGRAAKKAEKKSDSAVETLLSSVEQALGGDEEWNGFSDDDAGGDFEESSLEGDEVMVDMPSEPKSFDESPAEGSADGEENTESASRDFWDVVL